MLGLRETTHLRMPVMCYQLVEIFSACKCLYYQHAVDYCASYGRRGHVITERTILVGYACQMHSMTDVHAEEPSLSSESLLPARKGKRKTLKEAIGKIRQAEHKITKAERNAVVQDRNAITIATLGPARAASTEEPAQELVFRRLNLCQPSTTPSNEVVLGDKHGLHNDGATLAAFDQTISEQGQAAIAPADHSNNGALDDVVSIAETVFDNDTGRSYTTTLSSLTYPDLVDSITNSLLYDTHLQYLWPQLFLRTGVVQNAFEQIARLLFRYSLDLQASASDPDSPESNYKLRTEAARFMERQRYNVAREICAMFPTGDSDLAVLTAKKQIATQVSALEVVLNNDTSLQTAADSGLLRGESFVALKQFLFATEPFYCFRENIRLSVEQPLALPLHIKMVDSARRIFSHISNILASKEVPTGMTRLHCVCVSSTPCLKLINE